MNIGELERLVDTGRYYFGSKLIKNVYCLRKNAHLHTYCDLDCEKCPFLVMIAEDGKQYQRDSQQEG